MKFITEVGVVVSYFDTAISIVRGEPSHVNFPTELIWEIHQKSPGFVYKLAHTHPPGMYDLSSRDEKTLKAWAWALYPYPVSMSTITLYRDSIFTETVYTGFLEPKELWKYRENRGEREFVIKQTESQNFSVHPWESWSLDITNWRRWIVSESYKEE